MRGNIFTVLPFAQKCPKPRHMEIVLFFLIAACSHAQSILYSSGYNSFQYTFSSFHNFRKMDFCLFLWWWAITLARKINFTSPVLSTLFHMWWRYLFGFYYFFLLTFSDLDSGPRLSYFFLCKKRKYTSTMDIYTTNYTYFYKLNRFTVNFPLHIFTRK